MKKLYAEIKALWLSMSPMVRRRIEATLYSGFSAAGVVLWEAIEHGGLHTHSFVLAGAAFLGVLGVAVRNLPRDIWTEEQRKNGNGHPEVKT
jgi:hypothetical protein